jgi:hypothetical protein
VKFALTISNDLSYGAQVNNIESTFLRKQNKRSEYKATQSQSALSINPNRRVQAQETTHGPNPPHNARVMNYDKQGGGKLVMRAQHAGLKAIREIKGPTESPKGSARIISLFGTRGGFGEKLTHRRKKTSVGLKGKRLPWNCRSV